MSAVTVVLLGLLGACGVGLLICLFAFIRNDWVYRTRMGVLHEPGVGLGQRLANHDRLPSYDAMFFRFWVWDVNEFLGGGQ